MAQFWNTPDAASEPKRNFRFKVTISGFPDVQIYAKKVSKPSFTIQETSHKFMNHTFYYPGRTEWNTVTMSIVDTFDSDNAKMLMEIVKDSGYNLPKNEADARTTMSKAKSVQRMGRIEIQTLNAEGEAKETWLLNNAWIKDVKFGELDYESDDLTQIDIEIRYDNAEFAK